MNCSKCQDKGFVFGRNIFPNGREKVVCECKKQINELNKDQVKNWRIVLYGMIGPYAMIMPENEINVLRDRMQANANSL